MKVSLPKIDDKTLWLIVFAMLGVSILDALYELTYHVRKGRIVVFKESASGDIVEGDFKRLETGDAVAGAVPEPKVTRSRKPRLKPFVEPVA